MRQVKKEYLAIVYGVPDTDSGTIDVPILSNNKASERAVPQNACCATIRLLCHKPPSAQ